MAGKKAELIAGDMAIGEAVTKYPGTIPIFLEYGLHCIGCHVAASETLEQGAFAHGMSEKTFAEFMKALNKAAAKGRKKR